MHKKLQEILKRIKDFNYYGWLTEKEASILNNYIEQLKQENKDLKKQLYSPDQVETVCPKCGEKFSINYSREIYDLRKEKEELKRINGSLQSALSLSRQKYNNDKARYRRKYKKEHNILTKFESWLIYNYALYIPEIFKNSPVKEIYKKLQELKKEGKK